MRSFHHCYLGTMVHELLIGFLNDDVLRTVEDEVSQAERRRGEYEAEL